jgi:peptidoglycan/LPS O-acetylase OafA/YrhL
MNTYKRKNTSTINNLMIERFNNFDIIRLLAAIMVIFSHSFPLSLGYIDGRDPDPLNQLTGDISLGHIAVMIFFIISGFLITQSFDRSNNSVLFLKARMLRIFPALIFVVVLTVFILGPLVSTLPTNEYFSSKSTFKYLMNITLYFMVYPLPGVFEQNTYPNAINGSLWTLIFEFRCYLVVLILGVTRLLRKEIILILFILASVLNSLGIGGLNIEMFVFFSAGMLFYIYRNKISLNFNISLILTIITLISLFYYKNYYLPIITICLTYIVMYLTFASKTKINGSKFGDLSYGTYIFAFPIQQLVTYYFGGLMTWWLNFLISLPITLIFATISWHLIEKNALKYKKVTLFKKPLFIKQAS